MPRKAACDLEFYTCTLHTDETQTDGTNKKSRKKFIFIWPGVFDTLRVWKQIHGINLKKMFNLCKFI